MGDFDLTPEQLEDKAANHPERALAFSTDAQAKAKTNKKYYCEACDLACKSGFDIDNHINTKKHLQNAAAHSNSMLD
jgi:hypothetical protein